jgi:DNA topoisomerase-1
MRHLVIVESPSKCKTIEKYLGPDYRVIATCGHFRGLHKLEQIHRETLEIKFDITKPKIVKFLKEEVGIAKSVYLATDDDREGEAIAWHICKVCKLPLTTPRLVFHEITPSAIHHAITHPTVLSLSRVNAQHTRQILDLYIGYTISPILWKTIQHTLSAGRCQTPALHMIAEQQDKITGQSTSTCFKVKAYFTHKQIEFILERPLSSDEVDPFFASIPSTFILLPPELKEVTLNPPSILMTSTFQQKASHALHLSPKQLMDSAQLLYEVGLITYMRTDQPTYSDAFIEKAKQFLGDRFHPPLKKEDKEGAHEGIRITQFETKMVSIDKQTDRVYAFLYHYTCQTCMKPTQLIHKLYKTLCNGLYLVHTSVSVKEKGWSEKEDKDWSTYLDHLKRFHCERIHAEEQRKDPEFHWTEAQLIQHLEKHQIGRPSTYTHIVETLQEKKYVSLGKIKRPSLPMRHYVWKEQTLEKTVSCEEIEESRKLSLTPLGKEVNDFCYQHFDSLFNYSYSRLLEKHLDRIEQGVDASALIQETLKHLDALKGISVVSKSYPSLHAGTYRSFPVVLKEGRYGYYMEYKEQSISLKDYTEYDRISGWIRDQSIPPESFQTLMEYRDKNSHILIVVNSDWSLREGIHGPYLFYKTSKMKRPRFYKYTHGHNKQEIEDYIRKNIKV